MRTHPAAFNPTRLRVPAFLTKACRLLSLPLSSVLVMMAGSASAQNLLVDPGFESPGNMTKWTGQGGTTTLNTDVAYVHGGTQSIKTTAGSTSGSLRGIQQTAATGGWSVPSNKIFRYKAWALQPAAGTTNVNFRFSHNYNGVVTDPCATVTLNTNTWQQVVSPWFNAPTVTTGAYVRFQFQGITAAAPIGYMDDMELETADGVLVTASAATGGTISDAGTYAVVSGSNKTFTITKQFGYTIADVTVDSGGGPVSQGAVSSVTLTNITVPTTVAVTFNESPKHTVSGNVTAAPTGGATVAFKSADGKIQYTTTTDGSGNYSQLVYDAAYKITAAQTGYVAADQSLTVSADTSGINFTLAAGRNIPKMETLVMAAVTDNLTTADGAAIGTWGTLYPAGGSLTVRNGTPTMLKAAGIKWENNHRSSSDGYRFGNSYIDGSGTHPIPCNGATIVAAVRPDRSSGDNDNWKSIVDMFYDRLCLVMQNGSGIVGVKRNSGAIWSSTALPNLTAAILSFVVQPDGSFVLYANGTSILTGAAITGGFTQIVPGVTGGGINGFGTFINVGKNDPDGWACYNGGISDVFIYTTALSDTDRATLEADIYTKLTTVVTHDITSTAGSGGSISPLGVTPVGDGDNKTYTITPAFGYDIADVVVDSVSQGAVSTYTFTNVTATHTIDATFVVKATYAVTGKVTDGTNPIAGATVYISNAAHASVAPLYTATTDASGDYSVDVFSATWYACASASGYITSADISVPVAGAPVANPDIALTASTRHIPQMHQLLFAAYAQDLTANGATTNPWPLVHPLGVTMAVSNSPALETVDGLQWEKNKVANSDAYVVAHHATPVPVNGVTALAVVKPLREPTGTNWCSVIDVFYSRLILSVRNSDGLIRVNRNGTWNDGPAIPDGQKTILSLVVQPDGKYKVYANGLQVMDVTSTSTMTSLVPGFNTATTTGFDTYITVGRNYPDGWSTYNGDIGAAMLWKTALSGAERRALETELSSTFGIPLSHNITASAGANGTIDPTGAVTVTEGNNQSFTIAANSGYAVNNVLVDGVSIGAQTGYTFTNVMEDHTIAATFVESTAPNPYADWAALHAGGQAPGQDYNNDGVSNGVAYFMGMNGPATNPGVVDGKVTWPHVNAVTAFAVEVSDNLADWSPATTGVDTSNPAQVVYTLPTGATKKFCRLVVTP